MNKHSILFIGLDTHKEFNEVAYIESIEVHNLFTLVKFLLPKSLFKSLYVSEYKT